MEEGEANMYTCGRVLRALTTVGPGQFMCLRDALFD